MEPKCSIWLIEEEHLGVLIKDPCKRVLYRTICAIYAIYEASDKTLFGSI